MNFEVTHSDHSTCYTISPHPRFRHGRRSRVFFFFLIYFLAVLGLHCCMQAFSSHGEQGLLFVAVHRLLIAVASLVAEHGL